MTTPDMDARFDALVSDVPALSPFAVLWNDAAEHLAARSTTGLIWPSDVGTLAWESLPEGERQDAMDELFSVYNLMAQVRSELSPLLDALRSALLAGGPVDRIHDQISAVADSLVEAGS